jgi:lipopolysaccharide transport system permease protein
MKSPRLSPAPNVSLPTVVIEPRSGWHLFDWKEIAEYRDLLYYLVLRDITVLYKQTVLGIGWAILTPFFSMVVFSVIFGLLLNVGSDGRPYPVFSFAALLPWTYFSTALTGAAGSLITGSSLFTKVYFPRVFIPLVPVFSKLMDFFIASGMLAIMMVFYRVTPSWNVLYLPLLMVMMVITAAGLGLFLSALTVQYRDVRHAMTFVIQILMYAAPVVWPASKIPEKYQLWYGLYPMVGIIEGFRTAVLNTGPMPWNLIAMGSITSVVFLLFGALYFRRTERFFADLA